MIQVNVLPANEIKYVKTISFTKTFQNQLFTAKIVYKRNPSDQYKMDDSKQTPFEKMMYFYNEECYPHDLIDEIILRGILKNYPDAQVSTSLMLLDVEKENIEKELSNYKQEEFNLYIQPDIKDVNALLKMGKTQWRVFIKKLPIYLTNSTLSLPFQNECSILYYDLAMEQNLIALEPTLLNEVTTF